MYTRLYTQWDRHWCMGPRHEQWRRLKRRSWIYIIYTYSVNINYNILMLFWTYKIHQTLQKLILEGQVSWKAKEAEEGQRDIGRRMWRTGWGLVSGDWDEQQKIGWCMEDPIRLKRLEMDKRKMKKYKLKCCTILTLVISSYIYLTSRSWAAWWRHVYVHELFWACSDLWHQSDLE